MSLENIPQQSQELVNRVTNAVEKTGKKVASEVSNITGNKEASPQL